MSLSMHNNKLIQLVAIFGMGFSSSFFAVAGDLVTYEVPKQAFYTHHNDDYTVRVRKLGGEWQDLYEYKVKVDLDNPQNASMVYFDMGEPVEVSVKKNNGDIRRVEIRPKSAGIKPKLAGNVALFKLSKPANISIEFDGDRLHNLHLFASAIEQNIPDKNDPDVIWFGPGLHLPPENAEGAFRIASNKTVYLHGGAMLRGKLLIDNAINVTVTGRGLIDQAGRGFEITKSSNVVIDGPIVINPKHYTVYCGQSNHVDIRNIKTFSAAPWTDGIDMMACSDANIDNVFLRTSDDSIAIYGHRWDYYGDARNIMVSNSVLWADVAHPINIGLHGNNKQPELIENIRFNNIDILGHDEDDRNYQGAMAITNSDDNLVKNVYFENIRIDGVEEGMLFNFRVVFNEKYSHSPGRGIENVYLKNISIVNSSLNTSVIGGYSKERAVNNIVLENIRLDGKRLKPSDFTLGEHVSDVIVKP